MHQKDISNDAIQLADIWSSANFCKDKKGNDMESEINLRGAVAGVLSFFQSFLSFKAMEMISQEILKPEYAGLNCELRLPTIAAMLGLDPVPNPVCSRTMTWRNDYNDFDTAYKGLHHPRKTIISQNQSL